MLARPFTGLRQPFDKENSTTNENSSFKATVFVCTENAVQLS